MNKSYLCVLAVTILLQTSLAQTSYKVSLFEKTPEAFNYLLLTNVAISANDTINEKIVDLVEPCLLDSTIERKKQHHKLGPVGWFVHAFGGFNWRAVSMKKEKFVGTVVRSSRSSEEEFTEYDINFDLNFHLPKYLHRVFDGYDLQRKYHKQDIRRSHRTNYKVSPFIRDTNHIDIKEYRLHCELTPPRAFRAALNYSFYPTLPKAGGLKQHPNFENDKPTIGFYGTFCLDCNHNCHPELHPYEWMWWLKSNDGDDTYEKVWTIGLFHEGSNRMKNWSVNPMTGSIAIPFAFELDDNDPGYNVIEIEHLVFNKFLEEELTKVAKPANVIKPKDTYQTINILNGDSLLTTVDVRFMRSLSTEGLQYWFSNLNFDAWNKVLSGMFNIATSVMDLYTTQIKFTKGYDY
jgi:hypothetical protein